MDTMMQNLFNRDVLTFPAAVAPAAAATPTGDSIPMSVDSRFLTGISLSIP